MGKHFLYIVALLLISCESSDLTSRSLSRKYNEVGEYIRRASKDFTEVPPQLPCTLTPYFFETGLAGKWPKVTKEYFRCKGCSLNPPHTETVRGEVVKIHDCGGGGRHSLSLREGKEFIYPALLNLLNYIQEKTGKRVVITSGYRCPEHNAYVDSSPMNQTSKHQIGAEVDFYVQGMENKPLEIVSIIQSYYTMHSKYRGDKELITFKRYQKKDVNTKQEPWMNKEIFVKLYSATEGRNYDNRHPYPYLSIQVRYDLEKNERVAYSWDLAFRGFMRY